MFRFISFSWLCLLFVSVLFSGVSAQEIRVAEPLSMYRSIDDGNPLRFFQPNKTGINAGDLNGDGITDFLRHQDYSADERTESPDDFLEKTMAFNLDEEGQISNYSIYYGGLLYPVGDLNNDGRTDVVVINETGIDIHSFAQGDLDLSNIGEPIFETEFGMEVNQFVGEHDFDGDGIEDLFTGLVGYSATHDCFIIFGANDSEMIESKGCGLEEVLNQRTGNLNAGDVIGDSSSEPIILSVGSWPYEHRLDILKVSTEREISIDSTQSLGDLNLNPVDSRVFVSNIDGINQDDVLISSNRFQPAGLFQQVFFSPPVTYAAFNLGEEADSTFSPFQTFKNDFIIDQVYENADGSYSAFMMNNEQAIHCEQANIDPSVSQFNDACTHADTLDNDSGAILFSSTYYPKIDRGVDLQALQLKKKVNKKNVARIGIGFATTRDSGVRTWTGGYSLNPFQSNRNIVRFLFIEERIMGITGVRNTLKPEGPKIDEVLTASFGPGIGINFFLTKDATVELSLGFEFGTIITPNEELGDQYASYNVAQVEPVGSHVAMSTSSGSGSDISVQQMMFRLGSSIWMGGGNRKKAISDTVYIDEVQVIDFGELEDLSLLDNHNFDANNIGDINNDDYEDVLFTSTYTNIIGGGALNKAWGFYGGETFSETPDFIIDFKEDTTFNEFSSPGLGTAVDGVGDVNGDGIEDFAIGLPYYNYQSNTGVVYVYFGSETGGQEKITNTFEDPYPDLILKPRELEGQVVSAFGTNISGGDFNGDGANDIAILSDFSYGTPTPPAIQIFFGGEGMDGEPDYFLYLNKSSLGGDSSDLITGTPGSSIQFLPLEIEKVNQDILYVPGAFSGYPDAAIYDGGLESDSLPDIRLIGPNVNESFGFFDRSSMAAGDINDDGYYDIFMVKPIDSNDAFLSGRTYSYSPNSGIINSNEEIENPLEYRLSQNYPNPFNPSTTIEFRLGKASNVSLTVYDILGREVATLINNEQYSAGSQSVRFDASELASGVYIYRLEAGGFIQTRKMTLIK